MFKANIQNIRVFMLNDYLWQQHISLIQRKILMVNALTIQPF